MSDAPIFCHHREGRRHLFGIPDRTVGVKLPVDRRGGVRSIKEDGFPVPGRSLLDHIALIQDLEEDPGCRVVMETSAQDPRRGSAAMRDGNERLFDMLEATKRLSGMRSGAGKRFCRSG